MEIVISDTKTNFFTMIFYRKTLLSRLEIIGPEKARI